VLGIDNEDVLISEGDIEELVSQIKDPLGYFYRFSLPKSFLRKKRQKEV